MYWSDMAMGSDSGHCVQVWPSYLTIVDKASDTIESSPWNSLLLPKWGCRCLTWTIQKWSVGYMILSPPLVDADLLGLSWWSKCLIVILLQKHTGKLTSYSLCRVLPPLKKYQVLGTHSPRIVKILAPHHTVNCHPASFFNIFQTS